MEKSTQMSNIAQYLNPDNPATTSSGGTDKSPLAMLAATCENIGLPSSGKEQSAHKLASFASTSKKSPTASLHADHHRQQQHAHHHQLRDGARPAAAKADPSSLLPGLALPHASALAAAAAAAAAAAHPPLPPVSAEYSGATLAALANLLQPQTHPTGLPRLCTDPSCKGLCPAQAPSCPIGCAACPPLAGVLPPSVFSPTATSLAVGTDWPSLLLAAYSPYLTASTSSALSPLPPVSTTAPVSAAHRHNGEAADCARRSSASRDNGSEQHVCNWVSSSGPCHQQFASAELLLAHLLTHTNCSKASSHTLSAGGKAPSSHSSASSSARHHPYTVGSGALSLPLRASPIARVDGAAAASAHSHAAAALAAAAPIPHANTWANYAALLYGQRLPPL